MTVRSIYRRAGLLLLVALVSILPVACGGDDGGNTDLSTYPEFEVADPLGICTFSGERITGCAYNFNVAELTPGNSVGKVFRIVNTGTAVLTIKGVNLAYQAEAGEDPPAFDAYVTDSAMRDTLASGGTLRIAPAGSSGSDPTELNVTVKYTKYDDDKNRTALLTFLTDAANAQDGTIKVTLGTVIGVPRISVSPELVVFERVGKGDEKTQRLNILNTGSMDLMIDKFYLSGTQVYSLIVDGVEYPISTETIEGIELSPPMVVPPQQTTYMTVKFKPENEDPASAELKLMSNDPTKAEGLIIAIAGNEGLPCIRVEPDPVHFGAKKINQTAVFPVEIGPCLNSETALEITGLKITAGQDLFGIDFAMSGIAEPTAEAPLIVPAGENITLQLTFTPVEVSAKDVNDQIILSQGTLLIENNSFENNKEVLMDGAGVEIECPTAVIKCAEGSDVIPQTVLHLVGTQSFASSGVINKWEWSVVQPPLSASVFVPSYNFPDPSFEANVAGIYEFSLNVWDSNGNKSCMPGRYDVMVTPDEAIHVEALWHTPGDADETDTGPDAGADLDLHFAHPWANQPDVDKDGFPDPWFDNLFDCFWFNPNPNWGSYQADINDNPGLDRDDTDGAGPENMNLAIPENVVYRVGMHYWNDHGYGPSYATVRVYIYGVLVFEIKDVLMVDQDMWDAATVEWPSGKVTQVQGTGGSTYKITPNYQNPYFFNP